MKVGWHPVSRWWETIKASDEMERVYCAIYGTYHALLYHISPHLVAKHRYRLSVGRELPLENPVTFDEKLLWLMLNWHHPLKSQCADKFGVRAYLEDHGLGHLLVDLLGTYDKASDIPFADLPDRFVLKCTHGCGFNILVRGRQDFDPERICRQLTRWMKQNYAQVNGEIQYETIKPRIICERFLDDGSNAALVDYKMHCFHGRVHFTTVCTGRGLNGEGAAYDHFDRDWKSQLAISKSGLHPERWCPPPACYPQMLEAAETLSKPFPYVRMDFYVVGGKALLGEMTFTPAGCIDTGYTDEAQHFMGSLIHLPAGTVPA